MTYLIAGLVIFFGTHIFSALRSRATGQDLRQKLGDGPFMLGYSLIALIGFGLIVYGYDQTRGAGVLYTPPTGLQHLNSLFMIPALILLAASQLPAGHIKRASRHPMLVAVKLWAVGHLLANGEVNSVLLFGSFLAYAVFDRIMVKRRGEVGPGPDVTVSAQMDGLAVGLGLAVYASFILWFHPLLFGVAAIPVSG